MDRRGFIESCTAGAACASAATAWPAFAASARPKPYSRVLLVDELGEPVRASRLRPLDNYVFHYPFEATPVFLLRLGQAANPKGQSPGNDDSSAWPGGVGADRCVVAYSAICT
ncbi:MAG: (2Fe-2S)-binding protein, partial [Pseudomonadota bacterium]|nr:(2Fe-2S)-binding protein [Pseudomonadota bacterium]